MSDHGIFKNRGGQAHNKQSVGSKFHDTRKAAFFCADADNKPANVTRCVSFAPFSEMCDRLPSSAGFVKPTDESVETTHNVAFHHEEPLATRHSGHGPCHGHFSIAIKEQFLFRHKKQTLCPETMSRYWKRRKSDLRRQVAEELVRVAAIYRLQQQV